MTYKIHITKTAERDILEAIDHIAYVLKNPMAADALSEAVETQISTLSEYPQRHKLPDDPFLKSVGVRFMRIKNYLAFYTVDESSGTVYVVRFLYGRSDWVNILKDGYR